MFNVYIYRHGQSLYNAKCNNLKQQMKEQYNDHCQEYMQIKYSSQFLDCDISQKGLEMVLPLYQCKKAAEQYSNLNVALVLVSPMLRALRTCHQIFKHNHCVKIIVEPLLRQRLSSSCDIGLKLFECQKYFPRFDFQFLNRYQNKNLWFLETIYPQEKRKELLNSIGATALIDNKQSKSKIQKVAVKVLQEMKKKKNRYQSPEQVSFRMQLFKEKFFRQYIKLIKQNQRIAIVSHSFTIGQLTATEFDKNGSQKNGLNLQPCQLAQYTLHK